MPMFKKRQSHESLVSKNDVVRTLPTPLFLMAIGMWVVSASALMLLFHMSHIVPFLVVGGLLIVVAGLALACSLSLHFGSILAGMGLGLLVACVGAQALWQGETVLAQTDGIHVFEVVEDGKISDYGAQCVARVMDVEGAPRVQVYLPQDVKPPSFGERFEAYACFSKTPEQSRIYALQRGIVGRAKCSSYVSAEPQGVLGVITSIRVKAIKALLYTNADNDCKGAESEIFQEVSDGAGICTALLCGWRNNVSEEVNQAFKTTGLAHVLAVSGAHLSVIVSIFSLILKRIALPRVCSVVIQIALMAIYVVFSGSSPSVIRAAVMASIAICSFFAARRAVPLQALGICVIGALVCSPSSALSVSFALSVLATLGILVFSPLCRSWFEFALRGRFVLLIDVLSVCAAANMATLPLAAGLFAQIPLIGVLSNIIVSPLFAPLCTICMICLIVGLVFPVLAPIALSGAQSLCALFGSLVVGLSHIPGGCIAIDVPVVEMLFVTGVFMAGLWFWWPQPSAKSIACVGVLLVSWWLGMTLVLPTLASKMAGDEIVMLDVGQGDAFLLRSSGVTLLIDTGNQETLLKEAIAKNHLTKLDAVLITHGDDDHMGCLESLAGYVEIDQVLLAEGVKSCSCDNCKELLDSARLVAGKDNVVSLSQGNKIVIGEFVCEVIWPSQFSDEGGNADSICLDVVLDANHDATPELRALFTGDAEADVLKQLIDADRIGKVDLLKVGHHGSARALTSDVVEELSPQVALIGVGSHNIYGHPREEIINILEEDGVSVFRSDQDGAVSCKIVGETMMITTQN